mgnify:CR=1 FL=1
MILYFELMEYNLRFSLSCFPVIERIHNKFHDSLFFLPVFDFQTESKNCQEKYIVAVSNLQTGKYDSWRCRLL